MDFVGQMAAAGAVLGLLGMTLWWLRRRGLAGIRSIRKGPGRRLESLEHLPLGPQHSLHLVRLGDGALLVACSPAGCTLVERLGGIEHSGMGHSRIVESPLEPTQETAR